MTPSTSLDLGNQGHGISTPGPEFDNQGPRLNKRFVLWNPLMELHSKFVTAVRKQGHGFRILSPPYELKFLSQRHTFINKSGPKRETMSFYVERFAFLLVFVHSLLVVKGQLGVETFLKS